MKYFIPLLILLTSCSPKYQLVKTTPADNSIKQQQDFYVYDNDTLVVVYSFWANRGTMNFEVFNKLNIPVYIDWKKSALLSGTTKRDYFHEKQTSKIDTKTKSSGSSVNIPLPDNFITNLGLSSSVSRTTGTIVTFNEERITFLPPNSSITFAFAPILKGNPSNAPTSFTNFFTFSTKESFINESYVNNKFNITGIEDFKSREFTKMVPEKDRPGVMKQQFIYHSPSSFYIRIVQ